MTTVKITKNELAGLKSFFVTKMEEAFTEKEPQLARAQKLISEATDGFSIFEFELDEDFVEILEDSLKRASEGGFKVQVPEDTKYEDSEAMQESTGEDENFQDGMTFEEFVKLRKVEGSIKMNLKMRSVRMGIRPDDVVELETWEGILRGITG